MLRRHAWALRGPASCRLQILPVVRAAADESTRVDDQDQGHETQEHQPVARDAKRPARDGRSEEHTSELQSLMRISYAVFCLKKPILSRDQDIPILHTHLLPHSTITHTALSVEPYY